MAKKSISNKLIMEIVQKYVDKILENYNVEAIILFGFYAKGTEREELIIELNHILLEFKIIKKKMILLFKK